MYSLKVLKELTTEDGRLYLPDHTCNQLSAFEVAELLTDFPKNFAPNDEATEALAANKENLKKLSDAAKAKREEE